MSFATIAFIAYGLGCLVALPYSWKAVHEDSTGAAGAVAAVALALAWPVVIALAIIFGPALRAIGRAINGAVSRW